MKLRVYKRSEEKAREFINIMNDMKWHFRRELFDELDIPSKTLRIWIKNLKLEQEIGITEVKYKKYGKVCTSTYRALKYRATEKIELEVVDKVREKEINKPEKPMPKQSKWKPIIEGKIGERKEIKKNDLVDIGIEINFNDSVRKLITITEELGVKVV